MVDSNITAGSDSYTCTNCIKTSKWTRRHTSIQTRNYYCSKLLFLIQLQHFNVNVFKIIIKLEGNSVERMYLRQRCFDGSLNETTPHCSRVLRSHKSGRCAAELYHASHLWYPPFYTSPMASNALQHWTASPTKEGCHRQAGGENRQTWQLANPAWYP